VGGKNLATAQTHSKIDLEISMPLDRPTSILRLKSQYLWDFVVIGAGATGASIAMDAAARGFSVLLVDRYDFGKGTSSRSTKLVHGGVRYLAQGNISLVRDALHERSLLRQNAPHTVHEMSFLVPCKSWLEKIWYSLGFVVYDWLAGKSGFAKARRLDAKQCASVVPTIAPEMARHGVLYSDGQFDDARLLLDIVQTAAQHGAVVCNYVRADALLKDSTGKITGVRLIDLEQPIDGSGTESIDVQGRCIINATGPFCDELRLADDSKNAPMIAPSQGVHIVLDRSFLPGDAAVIVPKTSDGRVIFMIPWLGHTVVGTTDTPIAKSVIEPTATHEEIEFLLKTSGDYLSKKPTRDDILSVFVGVRPLVKAKSQGSNTSKLSRDHTILIDRSGLVTITGGKWTTARKMAEDCVDRAIESVGLAHAKCVTKNLKLHGLETNEKANLVAADPAMGRTILEGYPLKVVDVVWAVRHQMARAVEDVLARRDRLLFLRAGRAIEAAPAVAAILATELGNDDAWIDRQLTQFRELAESYLPPRAPQ
jgi:glycerol-3-phosphate dehydrogenase